MKVINVYEQYFNADAVINEIPRHAAIVGLQAESDEGHILYRVFVNFFPFNDPEDFAVTYDARAEKTIFEAEGRRSRKREAKLMESFREEADALCEELGGTVFWDDPLRDAKID